MRAVCENCPARWAEACSVVRGRSLWAFGRRWRIDRVGAGLRPRGDRSLLRLRIHLAAGVLALALCPAAAQAATTSFGADLAEAPAQGCSTTVGAECSYVTSVPRMGSSASAAAPQTGLVTRVRLRTDGPATTYRVRVLSGSALMVTTLGEIGVRVAPGPRTTSGHLGAGAALPILAGQRLGLPVPVPATGADPLFRSAAGGGATCERRGPSDGLAALLTGSIGTETFSSAGCQGEALVAGT